MSKGYRAPERLRYERGPGGSWEIIRGEGIVSFAPPHVHDEVQIGLQLAGQVRFVIEGRRSQELEAGAMIVLPAGCVHGVEPMGHEPVAFVQINVAPELERRRLDGERINSPAYIPHSRATALARLLRAPLHEEAVATLLAEAKLAEPLIGVSPPEWLCAVRRFIDARSTTPPATRRHRRRGGTKQSTTSRGGSGTSSRFRCMPTSSDCASTT